MAIPLAQEILSLDKTLSCTARRYDDVGQREALRALGEKLICRIAVIGAVGKKPVDTALHLIQKIGKDGDVADILIGQFRGYNVAVSRIDPKMKLPPRSTRLALAKTLLAPFTRALDLQTRAVDNQIEAFLA